MLNPESWRLLSRLVDVQLPEGALHAEEVIAGLGSAGAKGLVRLLVLLVLEPLGVVDQLLLPPLVQLDDAAGLAAVLVGQEVTGHHLVETLHVVVEGYAAADLLLHERLHKVEDSVHQRRDVDHMHLLHLHGIGLLHGDQELLHHGGRELGEVGGAGHRRVQDEDVAGDADALLRQAHVPDHQGHLHGVQDVVGLEVAIDTPDERDAASIGRNPRESRAVPVIKYHCFQRM